MAPTGSEVGIGLGLSVGDKTVATHGELHSVRSFEVVPAVSADDNPLVLGWMVAPQSARWIPGWCCGLGWNGINESDCPGENPVVDLCWVTKPCLMQVKPWL